MGSPLAPIICMNRSNNNIYLLISSYCQHPVADKVLTIGIPPPPPSYNLVDYLFGILYTRYTSVRIEARDKRDSALGADIL